MYVCIYIYTHISHIWRLRGRLRYMTLWGINMNRLRDDGYHRNNTTGSQLMTALGLAKNHQAESQLSWTFSLDDGVFFPWVSRVIVAARSIWCRGRFLFPHFPAAHFLVLWERSATWQNRGTERWCMMVRGVSKGNFGTKVEDGWSATEDNPPGVRFCWLPAVSCSVYDIESMIHFFCLILEE